MLSIVRYGAGAGLGYPLLFILDYGVFIYSALYKVVFSLVATTTISDYGGHFFDCSEKWRDLLVATTTILDYGVVVLETMGVWVIA